jgi:sialate O-acetylesterase
VEYQDVGGGLEIANSPWMRQGNALPMDHLVGFELAGADGQWKPADAKIDGTAVILSGTDVADPVQGRYDWKGYPEGNLYNKEGLPATPFQAKLK